MIMDDIALFGKKQEPIIIRVEKAKELIQRGIKYFFGESGVWMPEYDDIASWLSDNKGKGLLCVGDSGRGKTFLTDRIVCPIIQKYSTQPNMRVVFIRGYSMKEDYDKEFGRIVLLDDVGVERDQRVYGEKLTVFNQIVYEAELFGRLLIVTTNLTIEELKEKYGERTIDRLRALTRPVVFRGDSLRTKLKT